MLMRLFIMALLFPLIQEGNAQIYQDGEIEIIEDYINIYFPILNEDDDQNEDDHENDESDFRIEFINHWFHNDVDHDVKSSMALSSVVADVVTDEMQHLTIVDTKRFGKGMVIDGHLQNAEVDEYIFHENMAHPALLIHDQPKSVFIMGGGGGSTAREVLKHKSIEKVVICEFDRQVVDFSREYMTANQEAFDDERLQIVYNDAKFELEKCDEKFDVILGDLCDPSKSGYSNSLYTKSFFEKVAKNKLQENGIFVTHAGPAGLFSHSYVFSPVYNTLKQVFTHVIAYTTHVPSYGDLCGWILASDEPINVDPEKLNNRIGEKIRGELRYLDGPVIAASTVLNKTLKTNLMNEERVITEENMDLLERDG